ncbi:MAG: hypothetical protein AAF755_10215 [Pseudomonadota bacterium]
MSNESNPDPTFLNEPWTADESGFEHMWRNVLAETLLELLETDGTVTRDTLKAELINRVADENRQRIERATYRGALKALDGNPPS